MIPIRHRTNYRPGSNYDPRIARRKRRLGSVEYRLRRLIRRYDFEFEFESYLGLPAIKVCCGPDVMYLREHGEVILNGREIYTGLFEHGSRLFRTIIRRSFPLKEINR